MNLRLRSTLPCIQPVTEVCKATCPHLPKICFVYENILAHFKGESSCVKKLEINYFLFFSHQQKKKKLSRPVSQCSSVGYLNQSNTNFSSKISQLY